MNLVHIENEEADIFWHWKYNFKKKPHTDDLEAAGFVVCIVAVSAEVTSGCIQLPCISASKLVLGPQTEFESRY
jgi:hypothetical protein